VDRCDYRLRAGAHQPHQHRKWIWPSQVLAPVGPPSGAKSVATAFMSSPLQKPFSPRPDDDDARIEVALPRQPEVVQLVEHLLVDRVYLLRRL